MNKWTGILRLNMEKKRNKTVTKQVYFQGAFKMLRPHYFDNSGQACYFLINPGGGYIDGDRYRMEITLEEHAEPILTTQSATKVYRTPHTPVLQENEIVLKKGSVLEFIPYPLLPIVMLSISKIQLFGWEAELLFFTWHFNTGLVFG